MAHRRTGRPPSPAVEIACEQPADYDAIRDVVRQAFATHEGVADLVDLIRQSPRYIPELALVARRDADVVGYVMLSHADLVDGAGERHQVITLSPLAVAPQQQQRRIGSALVEDALVRADQMREPLVILEGSPRYYPRFGFRKAGEYGISIDLPDWAPPEAAMVHPLSAYDPAISGRLDYPPAFRAIDEHRPARRPSR
jgi:putative acetyltransferase